MKTERKLPSDNDFTHPYYEGTADNQLRVQHCGACENVWFPPQTCCPSCLSTDYSWVPVSGRGTVWSWIVMHQPYMKAFKDETPYVVAFVQLEEGPYLMAGITEETVAQLVCDLPVEATFEAMGPDGLKMPVFAALETVVAR